MIENHPTGCCKTQHQPHGGRGRDGSHGSPELPDSFSSSPNDDSSPLAKSNEFAVIAAIPSLIERDGDSEVSCGKIATSKIEQLHVGTCGYRD
jgi:hypothetical protein